MSPQSAATINREYFLAAISENLSLNSDNLSPKSDHSPLFVDSIHNVLRYRNVFWSLLVGRFLERFPNPHYAKSVGESD